MSNFSIYIEEDIDNEIKKLKELEIQSLEDIIEKYKDTFQKISQSNAELLKKFEKYKLKLKEKFFENNRSIREFDSNVHKIYNRYEQANLNNDHDMVERMNQSLIQHGIERNNVINYNNLLTEDIDYTEKKVKIILEGNMKLMDQLMTAIENIYEQIRKLEDEIDEDVSTSVRKKRKHSAGRNKRKSLKKRRKTANKKTKRRNFRN